MVASVTSRERQTVGKTEGLGKLGFDAMESSANIDKISL